MNSKGNSLSIFKQPLVPNPTKPVRRDFAENKQASFSDILTQNIQQKQSAVRFSAHAERRLQERNISLAQEDIAKIGRAMQQASLKGARDSLLLYGNLALIASIKNNTVVTALDSDALQGEQVFTNIDSAVIIK
ncbi:flagellar operon protein [Desulfofarcimen acetoxidans DSM 771]|uniref:Flagellar operon protein n=2 Tax=Desulfofarcimen acetoxidans TaxID=58138 RepID=C8W1G4_DESAS|nr:flagellar operon protein [Desulfofarcimen acetoxidans DSM 771]